MNIFIYGGSGNMGKRYGAILLKLEIKYHIIDPMFGYYEPDDIYPDGIIITTPTDTHFDLIIDCHGKFHGVPILCEKPISKDKYEIKELVDIDDLNLTMVNQYEFAINCKPQTVKNGLTLYDFYNSGKDGCFWDTINIIGLHKNKLIPGCIGLKSPFWTCIIDGKILDLHDVERGYYEMIEDWIASLEWTDQKKINEKIEKDKEYIIESHRRVFKRLESEVSSD